jgi:selenocysteine-specific elongation factor
LPIDRAFTIGGFGAVVTGTLIDGALNIGDEVEILPKGLRARVRGLQTHQQRAEVALPGSRVAVNLAGISHHDLARGDVLTLPGRLHPTDVIDARLRLTAAGPPIEQNDRLELFVGACEVPCRVTLLDTEVLQPGHSGWVQIRLERPIAVMRGDRYILRQPSPSQTIGGGRIVDTHPARHRRFRPEVMATLEALARGTPADLLQRVLSDGLPHQRTDLVRSTGLSDFLLDEGLEALRTQGDLVVCGAWLLTNAAWANLNGAISKALTGYHRRYPLRSGMPREELRSRLKLSAEAFDTLLEAADAVVQGTLVRTVDHVPTPNLAQAREIRIVLESCTRSPYSPPVPELEPELLGLMIDQGQLVRVATDVFFLPETYRELVAWVQQQIDGAGSVTVAQFRDRFQTSRKYALALLEHLDERKITRRVGDARVLY